MMRFYLLQLCTIFGFLIFQCQAYQQHHQQKFSLRREFARCGSSNYPYPGPVAQLIDIRNDPETRKRGEALISTFQRTYFSQDEKTYGETGIPIVSDVYNNKIVLQQIFKQRGKFWVKLELILPIFYIVPGPTSISTVILEANTEFPINLIRRAFLISMKECLYVRLSQNY
ncbi:uncharacterized protein LOC124320563 [Daphnia pulicaria]|uniref:uncharacterized protein LOC124320563 n=1 Tax=Daphnia pulicaria TaxID=35523 RepID=UPI001EEADDCF|nr:uncharacterized protein LOC124320563 [Daphnia pulicaria]